ncbi:MAG TPA: carbohydrate ABC transporter permease [Mesotoga sp.]|jgi:ABC-type glycerol-3-phosphate transport system permease component|uniref:carbohydrate ABC transporter permease n=1 Tax=Mesotoga sp. H07.pep.5.3 TaxID=1421003 RepID=UPI000C17BCAB|nr:carbohydrate ABC transporter permease [Mesotoga sp. H07.pep.5.3]MDD4040596.1 carbohydrate ABC transporter permease [Mesotoga sp.]PIJ62835.1 ABC transporter permease [Mesotoga sp. H07.pep.5.3]HPM95190.1 carbohydrate ABC transporter permease [Mesotoga sp.]HPX22465.1 carbohydrate ABC transporter permease [Mesotoga sp.]
MAFQGTKINPQRFHRSQIKFYAILIPLALFMSLPIIFIFMNAFKPPNELFAFPPRIFVRNPTWDNFKSLFNTLTQSGIPVSRYLFNSLLISLLTVLATILVGTAAGYVLSKKQFRLKKLLFEINTLALMFVPIAVMIPRYIIIARAGLVDNFLVHILPNLAMPVGLFLVKQFIDQIPDSLIEAAKLDGANDWFIYGKIILPLTKPAIATIAILSFQTAWSSVEASNFYINQESLKNFAYYMSTLTSSTSAVAGQGVAAAAGLIMFLPSLVIFIFTQSKVMNTMAHSGIK